MKHYDFKKAKQIIEKHKDQIASASLGMHEDWFWTVETVFSDGEYTIDLDTITELGGTDGSYWATPVLELNFQDGSTKTFSCHDGGESGPQDLSAVIACSAPISQRRRRPVHQFRLSSTTSKEGKMASFFRKANGTAYFKINFIELMNCTNNARPICDNCLTSLIGEGDITLIPILNEAFCPKCATERLEWVRKYPEDAAIEKSYEQYYLKCFKLQDSTE